MYEYRCTVTRVVDGDTVDVDIDLGFDVILKNQRIRLNGIDAPESRTSDDVEKIFGILASTKVKLFVESGDTILRTTEYNPTGKFGRILGDIIVDGKSLCEMLVNGHYAVEYHGQSKEEIIESHLENRQIIIDSGELAIKV